jgi:hypothetical protein
VATTGVPHACASRATRPKDSLWLGTATTSAARYQSRSRVAAPAASRSAPVGEAEPVREVLQGRWARAARCRLGPPTTATTSRSRREGSR